jgi:hypothetical protein
MDEETKIVIKSATTEQTVTKTGVGNVWVNMKKLTVQGRGFDLSTPTATASIRGTVFQASTSNDSSTDVSVFDGKVAVGLSDDIKKPASKKPSLEEPVEVPGPEEIPGPYEVSLDQWKIIVAGQKISVCKDGKFAQEKFDGSKAAASDSFVKKNLALDKQLLEGK